jgi:hypothetical protein
VSAPECASISGTLELLHVPSGETRDEVRATLERLQVRATSCNRDGNYMYDTFYYQVTSCFFHRFYVYSNCFTYNETILVIFYLKLNSGFKQNSLLVGLL